ncbi:hypothetical protein D9M69_583010 [compost metagenome]
MAAFHHLDQPALDQLGRRQRLDALAAQLDGAFGHGAAFAREQVAHGAQRGRLAGAVAAEQRDDAAFGHGQRHALEHEDHVVVDDLDAVDVEKDLGFAHGVVRSIRKNNDAVLSDTRLTHRPSGNTAEPALPGRWCCPLQGGWRSDTKCAKTGG